MYRCAMIEISRSAARDACCFAWQKDRSSCRCSAAPDSPCSWGAVKGPARMSASGLQVCVSAVR